MVVSTFQVTHQEHQVTSDVTFESQLKYCDQRAKAVMKEEEELDAWYVTKKKGACVGIPDRRRGEQGDDDSFQTKVTEREDFSVHNESSYHVEHAPTEDTPQYIFGPEECNNYDDFLNGFGLKTSRERDAARKAFLLNRVHHFILSTNRKDLDHRKENNYSTSVPRVPENVSNVAKSRKPSARKNTPFLERLSSHSEKINQEGKKRRELIRQKMEENRKRRNGELCRVSGRISADRGSRLYNDFLAKREKEISEQLKKLQMEEEDNKQAKRIPLEKALVFYYLEMMWLVRKERMIVENAKKKGETCNSTMNLDQMLKYYMKLRCRETEQVEQLIGRDNGTTRTTCDGETWRSAALVPPVERDHSYHN